jgi:hypothetical protein
MSDYDRPKMSFRLPPIREMLPKIREAYDNRTLQMFNDERTDNPSYNGPCAIGVCMTQEQRNYGDDNEFSVYGVEELIDYGILIGLSGSEIRDLSDLQSEHDSVLWTPPGPNKEEWIAEFGKMLSKLEKKYA